MNTTIYASDYTRLDSNVLTGGGTDETEILQGLLDKALEWGRLRLVMDGAALIRGLNLHSNTTIECMDKSCGFFLADDCDRAVLMNARPSYDDIYTRNVTLIGGTYNHNCLHQKHHVSPTDSTMSLLNPEDEYSGEHLTVAMEFIGIENLNVRDLTVRDQRTFAFTVGNFRHVNIENTYIELENEIKFGNQDGFHFWGPGQFLTMRNIGGKTEDDFMNIGPDERDGFSSITDVLIDGVFLDNAWQGIRLLSWGTGRLDRVTVRNVTGTYHCFGFYINPWFISEKMGNFGNITFENIDLRSAENLIGDEYSNPPFLFSIGGDIEALTFRNIHWHHPYDSRNIFQIGYPYHKVDIPFVKTPRIGSLLIDGMQITETGEENADTVYLILRGIVERLSIRDIDLVRDDSERGRGCFLKVKNDGLIGRLTCSRIYAEKLGTLLDLSEGRTQLVLLNDVTLNEVDTAFVGEPERLVGEIIDL